jgi:hypothetical protein
MAVKYSIKTCKQLEAAFQKADLHRPMRVGHYDAGIELKFPITPVEPGPNADIRLSIEKFVGGGFAGQVYKVKLLSITTESGPIEALMNLTVGRSYAMKILIPPSAGAHFFRNFVYVLGFQGPFQLQVNPAASRAGALWQKFIRAAAQHRFGDDNCVNDLAMTTVSTIFMQHLSTAHWVVAARSVTGWMDVPGGWRWMTIWIRSNTGEKESRSMKVHLAHLSFAVSTPL